MNKKTDDRAEGSRNVDEGTAINKPHISDREAIGKRGAVMKRVRVMSMADFKKEYPRIAHRSFQNAGMASGGFCRADRLSKAVAGTFAMPPKEDPSAEKDVFAYCLTDKGLIFIDDGDYVHSVLKRMEDYQTAEDITPYSDFFDFANYLIKEDVIYLQRYEENLARLEESLLDDTMSSDDFDRKILSVRRDLAALSAYYEQLSDLGETLRQDAAERGLARESLLFDLYSDRAGRLYSMVQMLKEYSLQLREMHQTRVDARQNEIMTILTIVTTVFMPLTLITGWYGMNFQHMPELATRFGYPVICIVCVLIIAVEIWIFRKKKWFRK